MGAMHTPTYSVIPCLEHVKLENHPKHNMPPRFSRHSATAGGGLGSSAIFSGVRTSDGSAGLVVGVTRLTPPESMRV